MLCIVMGPYCTNDCIHFPCLKRNTGELYTDTLERQRGFCQIFNVPWSYTFNPSVWFLCKLHFDTDEGKNI